ncbi:MAG: hypothetical protein U1E53_26515 [Dongiaceae bacterium]
MEAAAKKNGAGEQTAGKDAPAAPVRLLEIHFRPPLAIARVGGSDTPLDSFRWVSDRAIHGAHRTVVRPADSLRVQPDGSLSVYRPSDIQFRDGEKLRPVAPFFELWATVRRAGVVAEEPLTLDLLHQLRALPTNLEYSITVANRKAQRRTRAAECAFIARATVGGDDHDRKELRAASPHRPDKVPLVAADRPIPLGWFQVIRPTSSGPGAVDLSVQRVRFTPATGQVYGPPAADIGPSSPLEPGQALAAVTLGGRIHEIVPKQNRILNTGTPWSSYRFSAPGQADPLPSDTYDGSHLGDDLCFGVVDDTCDGVIEAQLVIGGRRFTASARVLATNPDYAPDRRHIYSLADDLADRDPPEPESRVPSELMEDVANLFERVLETASSINLDATRAHLILDDETGNPPGQPKQGPDSMTAADTPFVDLTPALLPDATGNNLPHDRLRYADMVGPAHEKLADFDTLMDFLRQRAPHVRRLLRPPYGRFSELPEALPAGPNDDFRDPRVPRDRRYDMRMPPYMRDSDAGALSLTWRQYNAVMALLQILADQPGPGGRAAPGLPRKES